jgi:hypothetical protein
LTPRLRLPAVGEFREDESYVGPILAAAGF